MANSPPEIMHLAVDLHVHLVEMPAPVRAFSHLAHPLFADFSREYGTETVPPQPHCLMTNIDATFRQKILDIAQRQRVTDIHHHDQADHLGRRRPNRALGASRRAWPACHHPRRDGHVWAQEDQILQADR